jgi:superfamily I DNA/RNA helicase
MKWMIEETRLGVEQREIIEEVSKVKNECVWIQGHAGSGKSVVLVHLLSDYLIRNQGAKVVVVVYTRALIDLIQTGIRQVPALRNKYIPVITIYEIDKQLKNNAQYDAIFCDEVQDLPLPLIQRMKNACVQLLIAGDASQSIYGYIQRLGGKTADAEEITSDISPIRKRLSIIYRLTPSVIKVLTNVFSNILQDKTYSGREDSEIRLFQFKANDNYTKETVFSWEQIEMINRTRPSEVAAVLIFRKEDIIIYCQNVLNNLKKPKWQEKIHNNWGKQEYDMSDLNSHLKRHDVPLMYLGNGIGSLERADKENTIVLMTYHSAKGLDFDAVCLPYISTNMSYTANENALMLVALSRAKRDMIITYTGEMYRGFANFLRGIRPLDPINDNETEILF